MQLWAAIGHEDRILVDSEDELSFRVKIGGSYTTLRVYDDAGILLATCTLYGRPHVAHPGDTVSVKLGVIHNASDQYQTNEGSPAPRGDAQP